MPLSTDNILTLLTLLHPNVKFSSIHFNSQIHVLVLQTTKEDFRVVLALGEMQHRECFQLCNPPLQFNVGVRALLFLCLGFCGQDSRVHTLEEIHGTPAFKVDKQESQPVKIAAACICGLPCGQSIPSDHINQIKHQLFLELISRIDDT